MSPRRSYPKFAVALTVLVVLAVGYWGWSTISAPAPTEGTAFSNGRIEAVEIDVSTKSGGRLQEVAVNEGALVIAGQVLARMETAQLEARKRQAEADLRRAQIAIDTARSFVKQREAERESTLFVIEQRKAQLNSAIKTNTRSRQLLNNNTVSQQVVDETEAAEQQARAAVASAQAALASSDAAINAAKAQVVDAEAAVDAAMAQIDSINADIEDTVLKAPRDGRVQYRVAEPGEVLPAGGRILTMVDLSDVYMTFFLPTAQAGRVALGSEARIVLDAAPQFTIPAEISFVADVAQFTPKTVETEDERQKLTFRVRARIPKELLKKHIAYVKTGLPGLVYVRLNPETDWPQNLSNNLIN
ncbi:HlyD family secretion protein [Brucella tritici]|uniref:HlyD family secretion protein n=1 Tax=Brucella tritici TaxID=94626 RepID=UPI00158FF77D|nr:HlyD family efflux transporter periplasmic adaptor subunit [Brucella tritici]